MKMTHFQSFYGSNLKKANDLMWVNINYQNKKWYKFKIVIYKLILMRALTIKQA